MWSFFSRDPAKDFHYEIGEVVPGLEDKSIWTLHRGKKKSTGDPVSIFAFEVKGASETQLQIAKNSLKRIKTLRHPNILTFLDGIETDKVIYFATEPVVPLETYLRENDSEGHNEVAISWGLHQIVKGLSFLVNDCNLIHNNVCMASVFVDPAGEWKLAGVDYVYQAQGSDDPPAKILPLLERYNSPEKTEGKKIKSEKWSADMWGLGCLIWEVFNGTLPCTASLKSPGKIPQKLIANYCELVSANPRSRPNPAKFIEHCRQKGGFMRNMFVDSMMFLEEIQIKDQTEKNKFFASLTPSLDTFPSQFCRNKILPQLLNAFEYGNAGSSVLAPMFKIGKLLDTDEYQRKIVPCVVKLFSSPDRATRVKLLQQVEFFVEHLQNDVVNEKIFPNVNTGFMDTNPVVRESTIKAMLHLAPKLNYKNLNEELMKQFARLQSKDDQGGIRTNTTVCLGKIAGYINPAIRQKILCSAFVRAMKDPFPPARQAGILGMAATQGFYSLSEVALRLLPALCGLTRDPDKGVRDQAFRTIKGFLTKLEKASENPELEEDYEKEVMSGSAGAPSVSGWTGWAVTGMSSLTSKIYSKATTTKTAGKPTGPAQKSSEDKQAVKDSSKDSSQPPTVPAATVGIKFTQPADDAELNKDDEEVEEAGDGWEEDNWGDLDDTGGVSESDKVGDRDKETDAGWDDDDNWGSLEDTGQTKTSSRSAGPADQRTSLNPRADDFVSTKNTGLPTTDLYNWGEGGKGEDFFLSMGGSNKNVRKSSTPLRETPPRELTAKPGPVRQPAASASTKSMKDDDGWSEGGGGTGWDDGGGWSGDNWGDTGDFGGTESQADKMKREREEKKRQRQKEMQEKRDARKTGGAMKLGAKKVTDLSDLT